MTLLQKKLLYKNYASIIFVILLLLIVLFFTAFGKINIVFFLFVVLTSLSLFVAFDRKRRILFQNYKMKTEEFEARLNLVEEDLKKKSSILKELPLKAKRIFSIRDVVEQLVKFIEPDKLCEYLVNELGGIFRESENVLLFLFHRKRGSLSLNYSLRKDKRVIREKKGDIIDWWVLKKNQSLFIEDLSSDYRFDFNSLFAYSERKMRSILSSPLSIGIKPYGLLRLESKEISAFSLEDSRALMAICDVVAIVLERAYLFNEIKQLATRDSLTDLFLRNYFFERFEEELTRSSLKKTAFGLGILDIDDFKKVNDTYGHTVGDLVLKKISGILRKNVGNSGNVIARFGGEEFVFLIVESGKTIVKQIAERIRKDIAKSTVSFRRKNIQFTVSIGVAMYPKDGIGTQQLLAASDKLLYQAKRTGKNKVCST